MSKLLVSLVIVVTATLVGCLPVVQPPPAPPNEPPIAEIDSISATTITQGQTVMFAAHGTDKDGTVVAYSWRSDRDGVLSTSANFSTSTLSVGTHYIYFRVQDNRGAWSNEPYRIVNVLPPGVIKPVVKSFEAVPKIIVAGESTTLSWDVSDAQTVTISPDVGNVPASGNRLVSPKVTTSYVLTATNKAGAVTEEFKVTVNPATDKRVELFSIAAEEGYVDSNRQVGPEPKVGVNQSVTQLQAFFSFDISMIPPGAVITTTSIDITNHAMYGYPFTYLGALAIFNHQYGVLEARDFVTSFTRDALVYTYTEPYQPYVSEQLTNAVQTQVNARSSRFQVRVQFEKFYYQTYGHSDNYIEFTKGKAKLTIHYR